MNTSFPRDEWIFYERNSDITYKKIRAGSTSARGNEVVTSETAFTNLQRAVGTTADQQTAVCRPSNLKRCMIVTSHREIRT